MKHPLSLFFLIPGFLALVAGCTAPAPAEFDLLIENGTIYDGSGGQPFVGDVQIIADKRTPFRTLSEVIYTLGQTEFKNLRFIVNKKSQ